MQSSVRAVETYRRSRLIDAVTSDEDKIAPVYKLEEISQVLRSSTVDVVREMLEHTMKRLDHKNPIVKQKTLRFIKYAAGKGGNDFKREIQRQAGAVKSLFHYKGQLDALKGDALNKAVRDTAHEAVAAIFGTEETTTRMEDVGKRIQGFGSSNYDSRPREEEKKSMLTDLVGYGSQTIRQTIESIQNYNHYTGSGSGSGSGFGSGSNKNSFSGTYRTQGLRRSLTAERDKFQKEEGSWNIRDAEAEAGMSTSSSKDEPSFKSEAGNGRGNYEDGSSTVESRLLDSLTVPGGIRLNPTRETLLAFTTTAQNLDAANLVNSLELKLKAHSWQVRFKALCLIEASIRQREDNKVLDSVTLMFEEDASGIVDSLQSPQATLRDKAKKVMDMLGGGVNDVEGEQGVGLGSKSGGTPKPVVADLPDLLDTSDFDPRGDILESTPAAPEPLLTSVSAAPAEVDLFGNWVDEPAATGNVSAKDSEADPFAGMSFHSADSAAGSSKEPDLFSGLDIDTGRRVENGGAVEVSGRADDGNSLFDGLSLTPGGHAGSSQDNLVDLMGSMSTSNGIPSVKKANDSLQGLSAIARPVQQPAPVAANFGGGPNFSNSTGGPNFSNSTGGPNLPNWSQPQPQQGVQGGVFPGTGVAPQMYFIPPGNPQYVQAFPSGVPGQFPANVMLQPGFPAGPNYSGVNAAFTQQHFAPGFLGMPKYGGLQTVNSNGAGLPGNFDFSSDPTSNYVSVAETMKKEDTKAFDFITDHMSSQLGPKKST